jgi:hypothetical protein
VTSTGGADMNILTDKKCSICFKWKKRSKFNRRKLSKDGIRSECRVCQGKSFRKYRKENASKEAERNSNWQRSNSDKVKEKRKRYFVRHPGILEKGIALLSKWKKDNAEKVREADQLRKIKNFEKNKKHSREWFKRNPEKNVEYCNARRTKIKNAEGRITAKEWKELKQKYNNTCLCCKKRNISLTLDHIIPLELGGPNIIDNAQPLCKSCNSRKHIKIIDYRKKV